MVGWLGGAAAAVAVGDCSCGCSIIKCQTLLCCLSVMVTFGQTAFLFDRPFGNDNNMRQPPDHRTDATTATTTAILVSNLLCKAL